MPQTEINHIKTPNFGVNIHAQTLASTPNIIKNWSVGCNFEQKRNEFLEKIEKLSKSLENATKNE
jgi:hypothetical protein